MLRRTSRVAIRRRETVLSRPSVILKAVLRALGHHDLARAVRRVSLVSDQLGYDIRAPHIERPPRLLEVKATTSVANDVFSCFVSRNS